MISDISFKTKGPPVLRGETPTKPLQALLRSFFLHVLIIWSPRTLEGFPPRIVLRTVHSIHRFGGLLLH